MNKTCSRCGIQQPIANFNRYKKSKDGHQGYCRACISEYLRISGSNITHNLRKYAKKSGKPTVISTEEVVTIRDTSDTCAYCGDHLEPHQKEIEHIYAAKAILSAGSSRINLTVSCRPCNRVKHNRHPYEFYLRSDRFTDALFAKFARDFGERTAGRELNDAEAAAFMKGFRDEYYALQASKAEVVR